MSKKYTEDELIEKTCMGIFSDELNWEVANVYAGETFGKDGTIGRDSIADVVLKHRFLKATQSLNPKLPEQALIRAYEVINTTDVSKDLAEINKEKYNLLRDGIPINFKDNKGVIQKNKRVHVYDFQNPANNNFLAVQQLWVEGKSKRKKRPDIVGFVNGIPLLFIELKATHTKIQVAYEKNLSDYKRTISPIFHCNAFIILSNGIESKIGAITSKYEHFNDWKRIEEDAEGVISMDTIIKGVCEKNRFMDLFENFVLFDDSLGKIIKLVARNHQFIGVNKAIANITSIQEQKKAGTIDSDDAKRLGVFWHTQGSGKSYSMVFLCQKIFRVLGGGFTFLLVTDRTELDKQIYATFAGAGAVKDKKARASSGDDLQELLKSDRKFIFTLIHKFNFDKTITERDDIIVLSDEAHRTQGGSLAMNMRKALPNASFIGFTGTPIFKDDEITKRIFGNYVSKYDFKRSIEDGATVPLFYENRGEKLKLENPKINDEIREAIERHELDSEQEDKLKKLFARDYPILTAEKRLRAIAKDVVQHFNKRGYKGKAMYIAIDKVTAVKMYNYISEEWEKYLEQELRDIKRLPDELEQIHRQREYEWAKETEIAVILSHEQNEIEKFEAWGLDIEQHRLKMNTLDMETNFKDENHPFRFGIVCSRWITGFDVPSLSTLYIDKPLKSHTLMQAIARANRVHEGKNNGLIVDYIETYKALLEALAVYGESSSKGKNDDIDERPVKPLEELVGDIEEAIMATDLFLQDECDYDLDKLVKVEDNKYRILYIQEGYEAILKNDETKNKFGILAREVFKKYKALMPNAEVYKFQERRDAINAIYAVMIKKRDDADVSYIISDVQSVVNESIATYEVALDKVDEYGHKVDLSGLDFKKIEEEFLKLEGSKNIAVQSLKERVQKKLNKMLDQNPMRMDFYEKYQKIIEEYNLGLEYKSIKEVFDQLLDLYSELSNEEKRAGRENLEEDELTVFDMLSKGKSISDKEKTKVKDAAKKLLDRLKNKELAVDRWWDNAFTAAAVKKAIDDVLYMTLPDPTYTDGDRAIKTELLFHHFKSQVEVRV